MGGGGAGARSGGYGGYGGASWNRRNERTWSQPGVGLDSHSYPHTRTLELYVNVFPPPLISVATSTPQPSETRMKSSPWQVSIQADASVETHSLPQ